MKTEILRMEDIFSSSNGVRLLDGFRMNLFMGETLGLLINNVYKRSLVVDMLRGSLEVDSGRIYYHDRQVAPEEYLPIGRRRVACVGGESWLISNMSVAENIFVIRNRFRKYFIRKSVLEKQARILLQSFGENLSPSALVKSLSGPERVKVELIKASATGAQIILLNDLSRFLSAMDIASVFETVHALKRDGVAFLLVDTYLDVLFQYTDRMSIMDSGHVVRTFEKAYYDQQLAEAVLMEGSERPLRNLEDAPFALELRNIHTDRLFHLSLSLRKGEITSLLDIDGSTNDALLKVLTGNEAFTGSMLLNTQPYKPRNFQSALLKGVCVLSENPTESMLFPHLSALENLMMAMSGKVRLIFSKNKYRRSIRQRFIAELGNHIVDCQDIRMLTSEELQRLVYAKWLLYHPRVLVLIKPLSVTDPHLGRITQELIEDYAQRSICVLILSSNPSEAYRLGDNVYLCKDGRITKSAKESVLPL